MTQEHKGKTHFRIYIVIPHPQGISHFIILILSSFLWQRTQKIPCLVACILNKKKSSSKHSANCQTNIDVKKFNLKKLQLALSMIQTQSYYIYEKDSIWHP